MWYEHGLYAAYYTGRFQDVINPGDNTFFALGSTPWKSHSIGGVAKQALQDYAPSSTCASCFNELTLAGQCCRKLARQ
jgi:hypothetical protein